MDPEDLREIISAYQKCVAETVQRFSGFVARYMGDDYPRAHEDDAERAVLARLELIKAVSALKSSAFLRTRIGISTERSRPRSRPGLSAAAHGYAVGAAALSAEVLAATIRYTRSSVRLLGFQPEPELLAHHRGQEAAHRVRLTRACFEFARV
jgi:hypothetical protein